MIKLRLQTCPRRLRDSSTSWASEWITKNKPFHLAPAHPPVVLFLHSTRYRAVSGAFSGALRDLEGAVEGDLGRLSQGLHGDPGRPGLARLPGVSFEPVGRCALSWGFGNAAMLLGLLGVGIPILHNLLRVLDAEVLRLYQLPARSERMLLDHFSGVERPGVPSGFRGYYPGGFVKSPGISGSEPTSIYI
jgi:hypothetical protein